MQLLSSVTKYCLVGFAKLLVHNTVNNGIYNPICAIYSNGKSQNSLGCKSKANNIDAFAKGVQHT